MLNFGSVVAFFCFVTLLFYYVLGCCCCIGLISHVQIQRLSLFYYPIDVEASYLFSGEIELYSKLSQFKVMPRSEKKSEVPEWVLAEIAFKEGSYLIEAKT